MKLTQAKVLAPAAVFIFAALIWFVSFLKYYDGITHSEPSDPSDYAIQGRNIARGLGQATSVLRPLQMVYFDYLPHPEVVRHPVFPYTVGLVFKLFGVSDGMAIVPSAVFYFLTVGLLYALGLKFEGSWQGGVLAVLFFVLNHWVLRASVSCLPELESIFVMSLFIGVVFSDWEPLRKWAVAGALMGLGFLVRGNYLYLMPAMAMGPLLAEKRRSITGLFVFVALFGLMISPFLIRNALITGHPLAPFYRFSKYFFTKEFPEITIWRVIEVPPNLHRSWGEMFERGVNLTRFGLDCVLFTLMPKLTTVLAGIGLLWREQSWRRWFLKWLFMVGLGLELLGCAWQVGMSYVYYFTCFLPLFALLAACGLMRVVRRLVPERHAKWRLVFVSAVLILVARETRAGLPVGFAYFKRDSNPWRKMGAFVAENTEPDDVIVSDMGWMIAWYADRRVIWPPLTADMVLTMGKKIPIKYLFLTKTGYGIVANQDQFTCMLEDPPRGALSEQYKLLKRYVADLNGSEMPGALFVLKNDGPS